MTTLAPTWTDRTFRAMGTDARLLILGGPDDLARRGMNRLVDLESRWTRFHPDSELVRLNRARSGPVRVSGPTFALIARAVDAWRATRGHFDPTGLDAIRALGYDRDFTTHHDEFDGGPVAARALPGCSGVVLDPMVHAVTLPQGVALDLGGIGKGYAADLVACELTDAGADAVCVNIGGDLRVMGPGPYDGAWEIAIEEVAIEEVDGGSGPRTPIRIASGAVATSTRCKRAWRRGGEVVHHLLDPKTGRPAQNGLTTVTVIAGEAWWAEVVAKAVFVAGPVAGLALLDEIQLPAVLTLDDGTREVVRF